MSIIILQSKNIYGEDWSVARVLWGVGSSNFAGLKYSKSLPLLVSESTQVVVLNHAARSAVSTKFGPSATQSGTTVTMLGFTSNVMVSRRKNHNIARESSSQHRC